MPTPGPGCSPQAVQASGGVRGTGHWPAAVRCGGAAQRARRDLSLQSNRAESEGGSSACQQRNCPRPQRRGYYLSLLLLKRRAEVLLGPRRRRERAGVCTREKCAAAGSKKHLWLSRADPILRSPGPCQPPSHRPDDHLLPTSRRQRPCCFKHVHRLSSRAGRSRLRHSVADGPLAGAPARASLHRGGSAEHLSSHGGECSPLSAHEERVATTTDHKPAVEGRNGVVGDHFAMSLRQPGDKHRSSRAGVVMVTRATGTWRRTVCHAPPPHSG